MLQGKRPLVFISDFDGTISKLDFFHLVCNSILKKEDLAPWEDYKLGKLTHVQALDQIYSKIRLDKDLFHQMILDIEIEKSFVQTVEFCHKHHVDFYIISAGTDYYINHILNHLGVADKVKVISNKSHYSQHSGLQIIPSAKSDEFHSPEYGVCKKTAVETIKKNFKKCIFAGDGRPDFEGAKLADVVFARGTLWKLCQEHQVEARKFDDYSEILKYLEEEIGHGNIQ